MNNRENKTNEVYDGLVDNYLMHYGVKGQKKHQHDPNRRWQSQAVYAQGRPNPDAKVRGDKTKETRDAKLSRLSNEIADGMITGSNSRTSKAAKELDRLKPTKAESKSAIGSGMDSYYKSFGTGQKSLKVKGPDMASYYKSFGSGPNSYNTKRQQEIAAQRASDKALKKELRKASQDAFNRSTQKEFEAKDSNKESWRLSRESDRLARSTKDVKAFAKAFNESEKKRAEAKAATKEARALEKKGYKLTRSKDKEGARKAFSESTKKEFEAKRLRKESRDLGRQADKLYRTKDKEGSRKAFINMTKKEFEAKAANKESWRLSRQSDKLARASRSIFLSDRKREKMNRLLNEYNNSNDVDRRLNNLLR